MKPDPAIATVREVRLAISREFGNDPTRIVEYYMRMQLRFEDRLRPGPGEAGTGDDDDGAEQPNGAEGPGRVVP